MQSNNSPFYIPLLRSFYWNSASSKDHFFSKSTEDEKHSEGEFSSKKFPNEKVFYAKLILVMYC